MTRTLVFDRDTRQAYAVREYERYGYPPLRDCEIEEAVSDAVAAAFLAATTPLAWIGGALTDYAPPPAPPPPPPSPEAVQAAMTASIQARLDAFAASRGYDDMLSACTYATSSTDRFRVEGQYCVDARDATWTTAYAILAEVLAGERPIPASIADIEADLPALEWPS
jgi:hypothetical protein